MPIKTIDKQRLDSPYTQYHGRYEGRKEDYFALLYMTRKSNVDIEEVAHQVVCHLSNDFRWHPHDLGIVLGVTARDHFRETQC